MYMTRYVSRAALAAALSIAIVAVGCRSARPTREALLEEFDSEVSALEQVLAGEQAPEPGVLRFVLAFGAEADLDLFVTGPRYESVYFANTPSVVGGALEADLRCGSAAPRLEKIHYSDPPPGPYRVGIDFPERCDKRGAAVPFAVSVRRGGDAPLATARGVIHPGEFLTIVLETELR
ncbi:MAG: hypothetical protein JRG89_12040 [Deltaproteobacteria bacterium]|nr:hypothetical protein [Deltaproteobacteria bacterium]